MNSISSLNGEKDKLVGPKIHNFPSDSTLRDNSKNQKIKSKKEKIKPKAKCKKSVKNNDKIVNY